MEITKAAQAARVLSVLIPGSFEGGATCPLATKVEAGPVEVLIKN